MASFATPAQLILAYDSRRCRELASDTGNPVAVGSVDTDPVLLAVLARATEMVLMSVRQGKEYSEAELQTLADSATAGAGLRGIVTDLAFGLLVMRRGTGAADLDRLSPAFGAAHRTLQLLEDGELVFPRIDGEEHEDAGLPRTADLTQQTTTPTDSWSAAATTSLLPSSRNTSNFPLGY